MPDRRFRSIAVIAAGASALILLAVPAIVIISRPDREVGSLEPLRGTGAEEPGRVPGTGLELPKLHVSSALVSDQHPPRLPPPPEGVRIDAIGVDARIVPVGVAGQTTEVPVDVDQVGWFRYAGRPGAAGSTLLLAHVSSGSQGPGAFFRLRELQVGKGIDVTLRDGSTVGYRVIARRMYAKTDLPDRIFDRSGRAFLTLVTCGGAYSEQTGRFEENVVVYAMPAR